MITKFLTVIFIIKAPNSYMTIPNKEVKFLTKKTKNSMNAFGAT